MRTVTIVIYNPVPGFGSDFNPVTVMERSLGVLEHKLKRQEIKFEITNLPNSNYSPEACISVALEHTYRPNKEIPKA